jgi:phage baseplate assembly protein W
MALNIYQYTNKWAYDLSLDMNRDGEINDVDVINQSIELILTTLRGERLFNPSFGSDFQLRIFDNIDNGFLEMLIDDTVNSIKKWETRITILESEVRLMVNPDQNSATITIPYIINGKSIKAEFNKKIIG